MAAGLAAAGSYAYVLLEAADLTTGEAIFRYGIIAAVTAITAVLAVPPLTEMGVVLIAAHMIVYWFSQDSNITPPVCVAAYAGAAIAGADPWKTGWTSFKFAKLLYVVPLLFAFTPAILFEGKPLLSPQFQDEIMGAMVTEVHVSAGTSVNKGDVIATVLDGDEIKEVKAVGVHRSRGPNQSTASRIGLAFLRYCTRTWTS